jgi:2-polyprenyl-6-methoxyphenol hydroxylase-like FAD-dependent oxidoreductase
VQLPINGGVVQIAEFSKVPGRHKYIAMVPQWDFLELLAEAARREPTFTLRMNAEVTGLLRDGDRVCRCAVSNRKRPNR